MKKILALFCAVMMSAATFANPNPCLSVKGANDEVCTSCGYACSGHRTEIKFSVSLENKPSKGTTVVKIRITTDGGRVLYKTVSISKGKYTEYVSFNVGQYVCAEIDIISAYVK